MEKLVGYAYLQFQWHLCRVNLNDLSGGKQPSLEVVADFQKLGLPIGMGAFMLDSKLYMTGGEKVLKTVDLTDPYYPGDILDVSDGDNGLNTRLFVYDPYNLDMPFSADIHHIPPMLAPKPNAKVAIIDGTIYVLASNPIYFKGDLPHPIFECFDPAKKSWEVLPQPPWYLDPVGILPCFVIYFDVLFRKIHVRTHLSLFLYDVDLRQWQRAQPFFLSIGFQYPVTLPFCSDYSTAACGDNLFISQTINGLAAYKYNPDGTLSWHQPLHEVNNMFRQLEDVLGFVRYLGDGRFCYVYATSQRHPYLYLFAVSIYRLKMKDGADDGSDESLSVEQLHSHAYDFYSLLPDYPDILNVFIMQHVGDYNKKGIKGRLPSIPRQSHPRNMLATFNS